MEDYSRLGSLKIENTGLLSETSHDLNAFIIFNELRRVSDFIEKVDNNTYTSSTYFDVLLEARGLSDLLKQKYFNTPFVTDIFLDEPIKYMEFQGEKLTSSICMYGILLPSHEKKNIYSVINRLGFNDIERQIILSTKKPLEGILLIDLLHDAYDRAILEQTEINKVLCNKIMIILKYYLVTRKNKNGSEFLEEVEKSIEEFNDVLARKNRLETERKRNSGERQK